MGYYVARMWPPGWLRCLWSALTHPFPQPSPFGWMQLLYSLVLFLLHVVGILSLSQLCISLKWWHLHEISHHLGQFPTLLGSCLHVLTLPHRMAPKWDTQTSFILFGWTDRRISTVYPPGFSKDELLQWSRKGRLLLSSFEIAWSG